MIAEQKMSDKNEHEFSYCHISGRMAYHKNKVLINENMTAVTLLRIANNLKPVDVI